MSGYQESELDFSISLTGGLYVPKFYGQAYTGISTSIVSYTMNSANFFGAYRVEDYGGFAIIQNFAGTLTVLYKDTVSGGSQQWTIGTYSGLVAYPGIVSIEVLPSAVARRKEMKIVYATTSSTATTINVLTGITSSASGSQSLTTSPTQYILPKGNATALGANKLINYKGSTFQYLSTTYTWDISIYNIAVGYQDGTIQLYGLASDSINSAINELSIISSWNPDSSKITVLSSLIDWSFPNTNYLFAGTNNGNLYVYAGDGDPLVTYTQKTLTPTESLQLLGTLAIPSAYGYAIDVQNYIGGMVIVSTSNNYILVVRISSMTIVNYIVVPGAIKSLVASTLKDVATIETTDRMIVQTTAQDPAAPSNNKLYAYLFPSTKNVEIGLNYGNLAGAFQSLTGNGSYASTPFTSIFNASTNETFTLILDSSKPQG
jgi:hypothetical protein